MNRRLRKLRLLVVCLATACVVLAMLFVKPIPQDPSYHLFADSRALLGIPNFGDVMSNVPFLLIGLYGLWRYSSLKEGKSKNAYVVLCLGVFLVGFGSGYYHISPSTPSLLWDRLPMTVAFMSFFSLLVDERVFASRRSLTLWPLVVIGIGSAVYWSWTEAQGFGDLRPYALVQFLPLVLIPLILYLFDAKYLRSDFLIYSLGFYLLAKIFEYYDPQVFETLKVISGHSIKHLLAGVAVLFIILSVPSQRAE